LKIKTKDEYRLPSESDLEYACRTETKTASVVRKTIKKKMPIMMNQKPIAVGSYKPNAFGEYDMHSILGNFVLIGMVNIQRMWLRILLVLRMGKTMYCGAVHFLLTYFSCVLLQRILYLPDFRNVVIGLRLAKPK